MLDRVVVMMVVGGGDAVGPGIDIDVVMIGGSVPPVPVGNIGPDGEEVGRPVLLVEFVNGGKGIDVNVVGVMGPPVGVNVGRETEVDVVPVVLVEGMDVVLKIGGIVAVTVEVIEGMDVVLKIGGSVAVIDGMDVVLKIGGIVAVIEGMDVVLKIGGIVAVIDEVIEGMDVVLEIGGSVAVAVVGRVNVILTVGCGKLIVGVVELPEGTGTVMVLVLFHGGTLMVGGTVVLTEGNEVVVGTGTVGIEIVPVTIGPPVDELVMGGRMVGRGMRVGAIPVGRVQVTFCAAARPYRPVAKNKLPARIFTVSLPLATH